MTPTVCPYRHTDRPREVVEFFELLGLRALLRQADFAILGGYAGHIAVHPTATQIHEHERPTSLVLNVADVPVAVGALSQDGVQAAWWDEAFGRQANVPGPIGVLTLDEEPADLYGYDVPTSVGARHKVGVIATLYTADFDEASTFFQHLGFNNGAESSDDWRSLRASDRSGAIGLMRADPHLPRLPVTEAAYTEIGIETSEELTVLENRIRAAGHRVSLVDDSGPLHLVTVDPDGIAIEIYALS
jgi:catechol-2,3-dioxygenase